MTGARLAAAVTFVIASVALARSQEPVFRASVDVIPVDVQVIDRSGQPVRALAADKFTVTIDGKKRRVVSADLIDYSAPTGLPPVAASVPVAARPATALPATADRSRVIILAVDASSLNPALMRGAVTAAQQFVDRLPPTDLVGIFTYPVGPRIDPTTDHALVRRELDKVTGQQNISASGSYHLAPSDVVDLSAWAFDHGPMPPLVEKICPPIPGVGPDLGCFVALSQEVQMSVLFYEGQAQAGADMLRPLLRALAGQPGRKTVVLVSGGAPLSDVPEGRPNLGEVGVIVGKEASQANVTVYTLFIDQGRFQQNAAESRHASWSALNVERDSNLLGRWLDQFSGMAGGTLIRVLHGNGEPGFERIEKEIGSYYLLAVTPEASDRDGRTHSIKIRVDARDATVRGRSWVVVPKPGSNAAAAVARAEVAPAATPITTPAPRGVLSARLAALVAAFERADGDAAVFAALRKTEELPVLLHDLQGAGSLWPNAPRLDAVFALQLALAGMRSENVDTYGAAARLLVQATVMVQQPIADSFECAWHRAAVAGLQGAYRPGVGVPLIERAANRCPGEARFRLALAVVSEQRWPAGSLTTSGDPPGALGKGQIDDQLALYDAAMNVPETTTEARIRAAWFCHRVGRRDRALELLDGMPPGQVDPAVRYLGDFVRGQVLRARGDLPGAASTWQRALSAWPDGQAARVALMTLFVTQGRHDEAAALADAIQTAPADTFDPWWVYRLGDWATYPARLADVKTLAK